MPNFVPIEIVVFGQLNVLIEFFFIIFDLSVNFVFFFAILMKDYYCSPNLYIKKSEEQERGQTVDTN